MIREVQCQDCVVVIDEKKKVFSLKTEPRHCIPFSISDTLLETLTSFKLTVCYDDCLVDFPIKFTVCQKFINPEEDNSGQYYACFCGNDHRQLCIPLENLQVLINGNGMVPNWCEGLLEWIVN